jgi:hypothetical protein
MSRYYKVEVDVYPTYTGTAPTCRELLEGWGLEVDGDTVLSVLDKNGVQQPAMCFYGHMSLAGGNLPDDAHMELQPMFERHRDFADLDVRVASRWLCLDNLDWDEVIGSIEDPDEE